MRSKTAWILAAVLSIVCTGCQKAEPETAADQQWFTIEDITFDAEENKISGNSTSSVYEGEVEVYLPDTIDTSGLEDHQDVQVLAGPGMTMSIPPQLMNCTELKIIE